MISETIKNMLATIKIGYEAETPRFVAVAEVQDKMVIIKANKHYDVPKSLWDIATLPYFWLQAGHKNLAYDSIQDAIEAIEDILATSQKIKIAKEKLVRAMTYKKEQSKKALAPTR